MNRKHKDINKESNRDDMGNSPERIDYDLFQKDEDSALFEEIGQYMNAVADIEDVKNDPGYAVSSRAVREMIFSRPDNNIHEKEIEEFVINGLSGSDATRSLSAEIRSIKREAEENNTDVLASQLVAQWDERIQIGLPDDRGAREVREFVVTSLRDGSNLRTSGDISAGMKKMTMLRRAGYILMSAAAIITLVFLISPLIVPGNPEKLFSRYYEPYPVMSDVARSAENGMDQSLSEAIEEYKAGNYSIAADALKLLLAEGKSVIQAEFFLGLAELELGNFNSAVEYLDRASQQEESYAKEATWYLGLVWLRTGNKVKAAGYFEPLARSSGFYSDRSEKIIRRLK